MKSNRPDRDTSPPRGLSEFSSLTSNRELHSLHDAQEKIDGEIGFRNQVWRTILANLTISIRIDGLDWHRLNRLLDQFEASYRPNARKFWDEYMGPDFTVTKCRRAVRMLRQQARNAPNGPTPDTWVGTIPHCWRGSMPVAGECVVYSLFNASGEQIYIGSTDEFRARLRRHLLDKPDTHSWTAALYATRSAAYGAEDAVLKALPVLPRYNQRRGR